MFSALANHAVKKKILGFAAGVKFLLEKIDVKVILNTFIENHAITGNKHRYQSPSVVEN